MGARILIAVLLLCSSLTCLAQQWQVPRHQVRAGGGMLFPLGRWNNTDTTGTIMMANGHIGGYVQPLSVAFYLRSGFGFCGQFGFSWWKADSEKAAQWAQNQHPGLGISSSRKFAMPGRIQSFSAGAGYAKRSGRIQFGASLQLGYLELKLPKLSVTAYHGESRYSDELAFDYRHSPSWQPFLSGVAEGYISLQLTRHIHVALDLSYNRTLLSKSYRIFVMDTRNHGEASALVRPPGYFEAVRAGIHVGYTFYRKEDRKRKE